MDETSKLPIIESFNLKKHLPQSSADKTNDLFYILSAVNLANENDKEVTKLTLTKALYQTSKIQANRLSFLNTYFYINTYGPWNNMIYKYLEELEKAQMIKVEGNTIFITPKGSRVIGDLNININQNKEVIKTLIILKDKINKYAKNANKAIEDTHTQKVIDSTDNNKEKTIDKIIKETKPEMQFSSPDHFKYINPFTSKKPLKLSLPAKLINQFESELADVSDSDYEEKVSLDFLTP